MSITKAANRRVNSIIFSLFNRFIDPLNKNRLLGQLKDTIDRHLKVNNPNKILAPDEFEVVVNNRVFIRHAQTIGELESALANEIRKFTADRNYRILQPKVKLEILPSTNMSRYRVDVRHGFSSSKDSKEKLKTDNKYILKMLDGKHIGRTWQLEPGNTYSVGRVSTADICLPFDNISKIQATLYFLADDKISIVDEGSANGTFIDNEKAKITGSRTLRPGSKIRFSKKNPIVLTISVA